MSEISNLVLQEGTENMIVSRLQEKQRLIAAGDTAHEAIRTALIVGGGGMRGVYSTGITAGLEQLGMGEVFDDAIGISAGACAVAYLLARQAWVGPSVYYDDLPNKQFINLMRRKNIMDIGYLEGVFREGKPLDQEAVRRSRTRMHVGLTEVQTGKGVYLSIDDSPDVDIVTALITSSAIPGVVKQQKAINGTLYADGTTGCTTPIDYAIDVLGATDILVIMNYPPLGKAVKLPISERLLSRLTLRNHSPELRVKHFNRLVGHGFRSDKEYTDHVNIGVFCPQGETVSPFSKDPKALRKLADVAFAQVTSIFNKTNAVEITGYI